MEHEDYPGLYQAADEASINAQNAYLKTIALYLCLLITAAVCSLLIGASTVLAILAALIFLGTLFLSIFLVVKRYDKTWYNARAVAESVKTVTWRYMMCAEPYNDPKEEVSRSALINTMKMILEQNTQLAHAFTGDAATRDPVSKTMTDIRSLSISERIDFYIKKRIDDQRLWYTKKATENKRKSLLWFIIMCAAQMVALICVLVRIAKPTWNYLPVDIFIVLAGASLTWMQTKKFQDIVAAYSLTAHEISLMRGQMSSDMTEESFSTFVNDAENAFSREHTQWQARRLV